MSKKNANGNFDNSFKVVISGNVSTGSNLPQYIERKLKNEIDKHFDSALNAHVHFKEQRSKEQQTIIHTNIIINEGSKRGVTIKSNAQDDEIYHSFDLALAKLSKQLRKYKDKLKDYRRINAKLKAQEKIPEVIKAQGYVLSSKAEQENRKPKTPNLKVISEDSLELETLTVEQAIMKMDLRLMPSFLFKSKETGKLNLVSRRKDGNISWVEVER